MVMRFDGELITSTHMEYGNVTAAGECVGWTENVVEALVIKQTQGGEVCKRQVWLGEITELDTDDPVDKAMAALLEE
jgi:hypothetical protein